MEEIGILKKGRFPAIQASIDIHFILKIKRPGINPGLLCNLVKERRLELVSHAYTSEQVVSGQDAFLSSCSVCCT